MRTRCGIGDSLAGGRARRGSGVAASLAAATEAVARQVHAARQPGRRETRRAACTSTVAVVVLIAHVAYRRWLADERGRLQRVDGTGGRGAIARLGDVAASQGRAADRSHRLLVISGAGGAAAAAFFRHVTGRPIGTHSGRTAYRGGSHKCVGGTCAARAVALLGDVTGPRTGAAGVRHRRRDRCAGAIRHARLCTGTRLAIRTIAAAAR